MRHYLEVPRWDKRAVEIFNALRRNGDVLLTDLIAFARAKYGEGLFRVYDEDVGCALQEADRRLRRSDFYLVVNDTVILEEGVEESYNLGDVDVIITALLLQRAERMN